MYYGIYCLAASARHTKGWLASLRRNTSISSLNAGLLAAGNGKILYINSFGYQDMSNHIKNPAATQFNFAPSLKR
jgi:hypothetical protein